jgi:hypothetical protein
MQIYACLFPDMDVPASPAMQEPLRHHNQPCTISILRVSRLIHQEAMDTLYSATTYEMAMRHADITFLGRRIPTMKEQLPPPIHLVKSLRLCISIERHTRYVGSASCTKLLVDSLLQGPYKLRDLSLILEAAPFDITRIFGRYGCKLNVLSLDLECNLNPLRALRGVTLTCEDSLLVKETASICASKWGRTPFQRCPEYEEQAAAVKAKTRAFLDSLVEEVAQPRTPCP